MEGEEDLDLLASLLEENEKAEQGGLQPQEGEGDDLEDLFDNEDGEEYNEGSEEEEDRAAREQEDGVTALFGDVADLEEEEPTGKQFREAQAEETQDKSKQDLEAELRKMQEQMKKLQQQLEATQKTITSPPHRSPTGKQNVQPEKSTPTSLEKSEIRRIQESPAFSSQLNNISHFKSKQRPAHQPKAAKPANRSPPGRSVCPSSTAQPPQSSGNPSPALRPPPPGGTVPSSSTPAPQDCAVEKFSGLRLRKPRVSSTEMECKMAERRLIRLSQLPERVARENLEDSDWVTFGVIISKVTPQSSNSGKTFSIWRLNDLRNLDIFVSLFLFGEVHKQHWKTDPGTVIGILNPNLMKPKEGSDGVCLSVDNPQKILLMGEALDFGTCKSKKKNGDPCSQIVNLSECQFCQYHVKAQYKKMSSKRAELQSSYSGKAPNQVRRKGGSLKERLCQEGFHYGGVSSAACATSLSASVPKKPSQTTLSNLFVKGSDQIMRDAKKIAMLSNGVTGCSEDFKNLLAMPTPGALNLKRHLNHVKPTAGSNGQPGAAIQSVSASQLLKQQKQQMLESRRKRAEEIQRRFMQNCGKPGVPATPTPGRPVLSPRAGAEFPTQDKTVATLQTPKLGCGLDEGQDVLFFDGSPPPAPTPSLSAARAAALKKLRAKGAVIPKADPNAVKRKRLNTSSSEVTARVERNLASPDNEQPEAGEDQPAAKKRRETLEYLKSEEFQEILKATSRHTGALKAAEIQIQEQYFEPLVKKEQMEEKMRNIRELKCRAVTCKTCKYTYFKPLDKCVDENHDYHWHDAVKRFFKCPCGQRAISLDRLPHKHCSNCGLFKWERDGMLKERSGPKIGGELLLTRGEEHQKFLTSLK
ncbi:protein MCM10 homolog [Lepisosteus oculatus]|uniref:Protein MCM10 homolog n=1 Tax=Lepisosteus oculatus TaxID=7918 RepID=W5NFE1_LEPOC|nr:PREDICTED: protein MCM10 homolog [Lepisosteus oculatus]